VHLNKKCAPKKSKIAPDHYELFPSLDSYNKINQLKPNKHKNEPAHICHLIKFTENYIDTENLVTIKADKNAGICICNNIQYEREILNHLNKEQNYTPATEFSKLRKHGVI